MIISGMGYSELQEILDDSFVSVVDQDTIRRDYSGRGMFNRECLGLVFEEGVVDLIHFVQALARRYFDTNADISNEMEEFYDSHLGNMAQDSMGLSTIYYWPRVQVED